MCLFPSKYKFILHYNRTPDSCHSSSLCGTGEMATCDMRKEKKRRGELFSSGAAGRKIANILRHRRHRERDGASNWCVCILGSKLFSPPPPPPSPTSTCFLCDRLVVKAPKFTNDKRRQCRLRARPDISI